MYWESITDFVCFKIECGRWFWSKRREGIMVFCALTFFLLDLRRDAGTIIRAPVAHEREILFSPSGCSKLAGFERLC